MSNKQEQLYKGLTVYWQKTVDELVKSLYDVGRVASGKTAQSIGAFNKTPVQINSKGFKITISMPDHYQFLDEGVSGTKKNTGISRFKYKDKMPPIKAIRRFMLNRGINAPRGSNTKSGKRRDAESIRNGIAFAIARSLYENGQKPTKFYSKVINDKKLKDFERRLTDLYKANIIDSIKIK
mgnify:FL=1|tara:strand:+ start:951 stop:1493 length:543 start_codon:yes stop_codon:yes gene_type:complete